MGSLAVVLAPRATGPLSRCGGKLGNTQPNRLDSPADSVMSLAPVSAWEPSVNKNDLVERLAEEQGLTKAFARELVDSVFDMITVAALKGRCRSSGSAGSRWPSAPPARATIRAPVGP